MKFKQSDNENKKWTPIPMGVYNLVIDEVVSDNTSAKGNKYCNVTFKVSGGEHDGRLVWDRLPYLDSCCWKWESIFAAVGIPSEELVDKEINEFTVDAEFSEKLLGQKVKVKIVHETGKDGEVRAKIKFYYSILEKKEKENPFDEGSGIDKQTGAEPEPNGDLAKKNASKPAEISKNIGNKDKGKGGWK